MARPQGGCLRVQAIQLIINPTAGRGRTRHFLPRLLRELSASRVLFEHRLTAQPGEACELARHAAESGARWVVAVGGDGTVHEAANGLMQAGNPDAALGIIPLGSGNDLAKAIGLPLDPLAAIAALSEEKRRWIDLGQFGSRYFVNGLGMGLDGAVAWRNSKLKRLRGEWAYLWGAFREAISFKHFPVKIQTPRWQYEGGALLTGACNGPFQGGNFHMAPQAQIDDGLLDLYLIENLSVLERLVRMPDVRRGSHLRLRQVHMIKVPWFELETERPLLAHMDGEPFTLAPGTHRIEIRPKALQVLCGRGADCRGNSM